MARAIFGCTASKDLEIFGPETLQSTKHRANERELWAVLLYMSSLYIAKEKSKSRLILHLGKNLQSLAREGEVNTTCLKPVSPPGDYIFNPSVFSHLRECKCFCYTCHLHFCSRNVDPCFCSPFSCTHLLQPEQFMWLCILYSWHVQLSPHPGPLPRCSVQTGQEHYVLRQSDFQWHQRKNYYTQHFFYKKKNLRSPNAIWTISNRYCFQEVQKGCWSYFMEEQ